MAKKRILVVDDEEEFVDFVTERLEAKGFNVLRAYNGREGLDRIYSDKPDLVILDVTMPELNGYDVCLKLKNDEHVKDIPVIMLTVKFQPNDIVFGKGLGADAYLTKPLELDMLQAKIKELLGKRKRKTKRRYENEE